MRAIDALTERELQRPEVLAAARRAFYRDSWPIVDQMVRIHNLATPTWLLHQDGRLEKVHDGLTDAMRELLSFLEARREQMAAAHGLTIAPPSVPPR